MKDEIREIKMQTGGITNQLLKQGTETSNIKTMGRTKLMAANIDV